MSLPVSYNDDKQAKRRMRYSTRFKLSSALGIIALLALMVYGLMGSPMESYLPQRPVWALASTGLRGSTVPAGSPLECERSYDGKKPVKQYVVMLDAGSSGSRVHVYQFSNCGPAPVLVDEVFEQIKPGLSSFQADPQAAAKSLDSLLTKAVEVVPKELQKCTPVSVKATAGLRAVGEEKAVAILQAVREHLQSQWPFAVVEGDGVSLMSGDDEGVYAWVTANYLLGNIGTSKRQPTVAVFDLGGGSTQIVFEPSGSDAELAEGDHKYALSFGGRDFELYQHSYLGYGLKSAIKSLNSEIVQSQIHGKPKDAEFVSPCLPPGITVNAEVEIPDGSTTLEGAHLAPSDVKITGSSVASPLQCRGFAEKVLRKDAVCSTKPCAFNGVYQPRLADAFPTDSDLYVFSFFYDRTQPLGMPSSFSLNDLAELTSLVCQGPSAYPAFSTVPGAVDALKENPQWCAELSYMHSLLNVGYEIKGHREVKIAAKINGNELGWCLGASLPLLDKTNWKCRY